MGHFHYRRHFGLLAAGAAALIALTRWDPFNDPLLTTFVLSGALHGAALVLALRPTQTALRKCLFVALAAALSALTLYVGIVGMLLFEVLPGNERLYLVLGLCAVCGAITYGSLIRLFWWRNLSSRSILAIAVICLLATFIAFFIRSHFQFFEGWWLAAAWWFAFSGGIGYIDRRDNPGSRLATP